MPRIKELLSKQLMFSYGMLVTVVNEFHLPTLSTFIFAIIPNTANKL